MSLIGPFFPSERDQNRLLETINALNKERDMSEEKRFNVKIREVIERTVAVWASDEHDARKKIHTGDYDPDDGSREAPEPTVEVVFVEEDTDLESD